MGHPVQFQFGFYSTLRYLSKGHVPCIALSRLRNDAEMPNQCCPMSSVAGMTVITAQTAASLLMPADARNENNFCVSISILKHAESKIEM